MLATVMALLLSAQPEGDITHIERVWVERFEREQDRRIEEYAQSVSLPAAEPRPKRERTKSRMGPMLSDRARNMIDEITALR